MSNNNTLTEKQLKEAWAEVVKHGNRRTFEDWMEYNRPNEICIRGTLYQSHRHGDEWVLTYGTIEDHSRHCHYHHCLLQGDGIILDDIIHIPPMALEQTDYGLHGARWDREAKEHQEWVDKCEAEWKAKRAGQATTPDVLRASDHYDWFEAGGIRYPQSQLEEVFDAQLNHKPLPVSQWRGEGK